MRPDDPLVREADAMRVLMVGDGTANGVVAQTALAANADSKLNLTSLGNLLSEPEEKVTWVLDGVLLAGGLSLMAGKPKAGKSTFARCLALAVAQGQPFLNRATAKGAVLYLALEEKRSEVRKHFQALGATDEAILIHADRAPVNALIAAQRAIKQHNPALVIIDPLLKFARMKDTNDYAQVTAALEPLLALARESGRMCSWCITPRRATNPTPSMRLMGLQHSGLAWTPCLCSSERSVIERS